MQNYLIVIKLVKFAIIRCCAIRLFFRGSVVKTFGKNQGKIGMTFEEKFAMDASFDTIQNSGLPRK